ncbi:MAG: hypothetical protein JXO49_08645 [Deltaproteobacteria bacterium]|nr:hypothetical protein [Candidatus Anaeroferrophillus wilburensis]MBN2889396.1 hypothetical protein [Deltaproteobacteria bacterium]
MLAITLALYSAALLLTWLKKSGYSQTIMLIALLLHGWQMVAYTLETHHLPVFTPAASLTFTAFILSLTTLFISTQTAAPLPVRRWALVTTTLLLGTALLWPQAPPCFDYNHIYPYAVAFHAFRRLALAAALFATALFLSTFTLNSQSNQAGIVRHQGRTALLITAVFYLLSEDTGIIWCLNGWADVWRWTPGFIISSMVIMFLMLILHLPGGSLKDRSWYTVLGLLCGPLMLIAQLYKP